MSAADRLRELAAESESRMADWTTSGDYAARAQRTIAVYRWAADAADENERLREALRDIIEQDASDATVRIARAALGEQP